MNLFLQISQELEEVIAGLTIDELNQRPAHGCNSIGWLVWHLTRSHDRNTSEIIGEEQVWIKNKWYAKFNRPPDPKDTGYGHTLEDVELFKSPDGKIILGYHWAVVKQIERYVNSKLSTGELEREYRSPTLHVVYTVHTRLVGEISEGLQHVGQAAYVRGLIKGSGWLGR
jgi:hypothetical protein